MLNEGEGEGGFSLGERKAAVQVRFFSAEVCGTDFHQKSVTLLEIGARPVIRARLLSGTEDPVKGAQISSFDPRGITQGVVLEDRNGMSQAHQGEEPISAVATNGLCSSFVGMKVAGPAHASECVQNGIVITKCFPELQSGGQEDEKRGSLNHGNLNGNVEDVDDATCAAGDGEGLFVIKVRSPSSKQPHGREQSVHDEEMVGRRIRLPYVKLVGADSTLHTWGGTNDRPEDIQAPILRSTDVDGVVDDRQSDGSPRCRSDAQETHANEYHINGSIDGSNQLYSSPSKNSIHGVETTDLEGHEPVPSDMVDSETVIREASAVLLSDAGRGEEATITNFSENLNVYVRKRKVRSTVPLQEYGFSQSEDLVVEKVTKHYVRRSQCQTDARSAADVIGEPSEHVMTSSSNGGKETVNSLQAEAELRADTLNSRVETEKSFNVFQRRSKTSHFSQAGQHADVAAPKVDVGSVESEENLNVYQRRSMMNKVPETEHHTMISCGVEREGNFNVFQRRSKMNYTSQVEHPGDVSTPKVDAARVESEGNPNVFQRRRLKNQLPEAEHHSDTPVGVESKGNMNVFQRRSEMNHLSSAEHHADVVPPRADAARVESEGNLRVFQRRSEKNQLSEAEHDADVSARNETEGNLNVFQRRPKKKIFPKGSSRNDIIGPLKEVNEKHKPAGYVPAERQPDWLPEGWTLEIREGKITTHPRDKYYHDNKSGRIFRSKNEVLQFLVDERVGGGQMMSGGSGMKVQSQDKKMPPISIAPAKQIGFRSPLSKPSLSTQTGFIPQVAPSPPFTHMHPARMKTPPLWPPSAVPSEGNGTGMAWTHDTGSNGSVWIPWDGAIGPGPRARCPGDAPGKDAGVTGLHGGAANSSQLLESSGAGIQWPTGGLVSVVTSPSDQEENRGKLIFRLKRKQPDSEGGKGRAKRPIYEVIHGERASSSTSIPTNQEKIQSATREPTGQDIPPIPDPVPVDVQRISPVVSRSPNVVFGSVPVPTQVEKPSFANPSPVVTPSLARTQKQLSASPLTVTSFERSCDSVPLEHPNWGINPWQPPPAQHLDLMMLEPYTALGIPATARYSGLQQVASFSANHTHVFLDPVDNTIPLSWQNSALSGQASASVIFTASEAPTHGPFSAFTPSVCKPRTFSGTFPVPAFEHFPGVNRLNATATMFACSESGVGSRTKDSASNAKMADGGFQVHKALKVPKSLTKADHTKLFLDLGRRLCLTGVEQKSKEP